MANLRPHGQPGGLDKVATNVHNPRITRRRSNHNEIEKKRRDVQRSQLDNLRRQIPRLQYERPSIVTTITAAIEHIQLLEHRIKELENFISSRNLVAPTASLPISRPDQFISVPVEPHTMAGDDLLTVLQSNNQPNSRKRLSVSKLSPPQKLRQSSGTLRNLQPASPMERLKTVANAASATAGALTPFSTQENFDPNFSTVNPRTGSLKLRRDSSLLLPTNDPNTFLFGRRDSLQNFFASTMPAVLDEGPKTEFRCSKCHRGVESLIMIDCDLCHTWYHIRCVGIDSNHIPLQWRCNECVGRSSITAR